MQELRYIKQTLNDLTVRVDKLSKAIENIKRKKKGKLSRAGSTGHGRDGHGRCSDSRWRPGTASELPNYPH